MIDPKNKRKEMVRMSEMQKAPEGKPEGAPAEEPKPEMKPEEPIVPGADDKMQGQPEITVQLADMPFLSGKKQGDSVKFEVSADVSDINDDMAKLSVTDAKEVTEEAESPADNKMQETGEDDGSEKTKADEIADKLKSE